MAGVTQTRPHYVNQMGKTNSNPLAARHGNGMLRVNRPLEISTTGPVDPSTIYFLDVILKFRAVILSVNFSVPNELRAGPSGRAVKGVGLRPLACRDRGFESHRKHGCLS